MKKIISLIMILVLLTTGSISGLAESNSSTTNGPSAINITGSGDSSSTSAKREYIIKYKDITKGKSRLRQQHMTIQAKAEPRHLPFVTVQATSDEAAALAKDSNVAYIEENHPIFMSSDGISYNLSQLHVPEAQQSGARGTGVKVAVFDTGVTTISGLSIVGGISFVADESELSDQNGHGTAVASIIGAQNPVDMTGVAPGVELYAVKVLNKEGQGSYSQVISALDWAIDNKMDIISMSFSGSADSQLLREAVDTAAQAGILLVAASGNGGGETGYPAKYDSVLSVSATDEQNRIAAFSNRGKIDVAAPGNNIPVLALDGSLISMSGTSMAAPHAVGIAALLKERNPGLSGQDMKAWLKDTAIRLGRVDQYGYGLVDAQRVLAHEVDPTPPAQASAEQWSTAAAFLTVPDAVYNTVYDSVYGAVYDSPDTLLFKIAGQTPDAQQLNAIKNNNLKVDSAPFSIAENQESVSTLSGGITLHDNDLTLPGRNGLSFTLSRTYCSDSSQLYDSDVEPLLFGAWVVNFTATMYDERSLDKQEVYVNPNSIITGNLQYNVQNLPNGELNNMMDATNYANYLNGQAGKTWRLGWSGPDEYGFYTRKVIEFPQSMNAQPVPVNISDLYMWRTRAMDKTDEEKRFPIGKGWSWDIPYIKTQRDKSYLSLPGKGTYEIRGNSLVGYPWKDLALRYDSSVTVDGRQSNIAVNTLTGTTYYFSSGNLIQISDAYQNAITFRYSNVEPYGTVLSSITDAIKNSITITYSTDKVSLVSGDRTVTYSKSKYSRTNGVPPYQQLDTDVLDAVTDAQGRTTRYSYSAKDAEANIKDSGFFVKGKNPYLLLYNVSYPTQASTSYAYEPQPVTRALGNGATNQFYRLSTRYDYASGQYNLKQYTYKDPNGNDTDMGKVYESIDHFYVNVNDNLKTTVYDNKKTFIDEDTPATYYTNQVTEKADNIRKQTVYVYDMARRLPIPNDVTTTTFVGDTTASTVSTSTRYDDYGNVISYTDPLGTSTYTTDANHFINSATTPVKGLTTRYMDITRDKSGRVIKQTTRKFNATGAIMAQVEYSNPDDYGNYRIITQKDDGRDNILTVEYGSEYLGAFPTVQSMQVTDVNGATSTIRQTASYYATSGLLRSITDARGQTTTYSYDKLGRITAAQFQDNNSRTWTYLDSANLISSKDEAGYETYTRWNPLGWKIEEGYKGIVPSGNILSINGTNYTWMNQYGYDAWGRMSWSQDALQQRTSYLYDSWGRINTTTTNVNNAQTKISYDDLALTVTTQDPEKKYSLIQQLDPMGRVIETRESGTSTNERHTYSYNSLGNVIQQIDYPSTATSNKTLYDYDVMGRLISVTQPAIPTETTSYQYTLAGNLKSVSYPDGKSIQYAYDKAGRQISRQQPGSPLEKSFYDGNGNLIMAIDKNGTETTYNYDNRDRLWKRISPDETVTYLYDPAGRRSSMSDNTGTTGYAYVPITGQLMSVTFPDQKKLSYSYNKLGLREKTTDPFGYVQYIGYDSRNRISGIGPALNNPDITYSYYDNDTLRTISRRNGLNSLLTYDGPRLNALTNGAVGNYTYNYDGNSNITGISENGTSSSYSYDGVNRIKGSSLNGETYFYDNRGNRSSLDSSLASAIKGADYEYDSQDRLKKAVTEDGKTVTYAYNGDGLLVSRTENGVTKRYYYDGSVIVAEGNVSGSTVSFGARYLYGAEGLSMMQTAGGASYYYLKNGHGDVTALTNSGGTVVNKYAYDLWGNPQTTQETVANPFRYSGEYWDASTNLQYLRARWYDPSMGRFLSEDTYEGQIDNPLSLNLYTYVENNPLTRIDPSGHLFMVDDQSGHQSEVFMPEGGGGGGGYKAPSTTEPPVTRFTKITNSIRGFFNRIFRGASRATEGAGNTIASRNLGDLPNNVEASYNQYNKSGWKGNIAGQTKGTKAGGTYENSNGALPKTDSAGNPITYREFDVNNKVTGQTRDAERFVVGSDGSVYYTDSHYGDISSPTGLPSFVKLK
ncbi:S8 family serine peptidase [Gorillibacterium sp. sgz500922]|uniref:S8 family serine peptidase n=1 Tax=Gorillibacterium sp. sgz500922 TaxID=3446694 RepID=UPI003F67FCE9